MIEVRGIGAAYGRHNVLHGLSARFAKGKVTALVGPNGCGKSTLLKAIMGLVPLSGGEILLQGEPMTGMGRRALARRVAYLPQENLCPDYMTLGELVELAGSARAPLLGGPSARDRQLFRDVLHTVGLADRAGEQVNALSGGMRQRAWVAMVLAQDTDVILMDEPVNHLDIKYQYALLALIRDLSVRQDKTVVVVLHDLNLAATFADEVAMLSDGRLSAFGSVREVITPAALSRVFDIPGDIFERNGRLVLQPFPELPPPDGGERKEAMP